MKPILKEIINKQTPLPTPRTDEFKDLVGVFEGGGYVNKGVYSPKIDCRMKSNVAEDFCEVCQEAIIQMISLIS